jgi:hypothetical protein
VGRWLGVGGIIYTNINNGRTLQGKGIMMMMVFFVLTKVEGIAEKEIKIENKLFKVAVALYIA